jgi:long-chain acyl-CoA synthetase
MLSIMVQRATLIGFYDSMGDTQVDYCLKQTKLSTMFATNNYLSKITAMKGKGMAEHIKNVVLFDGISNEAEKTAAEEAGIRVLTLDEVMEEGRKSDVVLKPEEVKRDDYYMLNYTSGTTGDSKGVKVTHWGILSSAWLGIDLIQMTEADTYISYLPAPHVFENFIYVTTLMTGAKVGFF